MFNPGGEDSAEQRVSQHFQQADEERVKQSSQRLEEFEAKQRAEWHERLTSIQAMEEREPEEEAALQAFRETGNEEIAELEYKKAMHKGLSPKNEARLEQLRSEVSTS